MIYINDDELVVDLFAGGGGASQGIFLATGRHPDIAVNHDPDAVSVHRRNHPDTHHYCKSVWEIRPKEACGDKNVGLLWASPDCRHFSRAAGGRPKWKSVRSLPGVVLSWATQVRPKLIVVENVAEMMDWGPLLDDGTPCPFRIGLSFKIWLGRLRGLGYRVEYKELCAADFGAPTIRTRLVIVAARDNAHIVWPTPTHSKSPSLFENSWVPAHQCIDWTIPGKSIFERRRPLKQATLDRIGKGIVKYIIKNPAPFIAPIRRTADEIHAQSKHLSAISAFIAQHNGGVIGRSASDPLSTITIRGTQQALIEAVMRDVSAPADPLFAEASARVNAFLICYYSSGGNTLPIDQPLGTITTRDRFALVEVDRVLYEIVDIRMRMLTVPELARAQGFSETYDLSDAGRLPRTSQIRFIGNSVCPAMAAAVVRSNVRLIPKAFPQRAIA